MTDDILCSVSMSHWSEVSIKVLNSLFFPGLSMKKIRITFVFQFTSLTAVDHLYLSAQDLNTVLLSPYLLELFITNFTYFLKLVALIGFSFMIKLCFCFFSFVNKVVLNQIKSKAPHKFIISVCLQVFFLCFCITLAFSCVHFEIFFFFWSVHHLHCFQCELNLS